MGLHIKYNVNTSITVKLEFGYFNKINYNYESRTQGIQSAYIGQNNTEKINVCSVSN